MRKRFDRQLDIGQTAIEKVKIPTQSRDELPPVLAGLQWIFTTPSIHEQIFSLLEERIKGEKADTGRPGMDLWHVRVLGVVRLALDCDYDRLEYLVHYDGLLRQIMGLESSFREEFGQGFHQKTISENVCHVDAELLEEIDEIVVKAGRSLFKRKSGEKIEAKADTYVLETNVHFPTDLNLPWDAERKCIRLLSRLCEGRQIKGWRKAKDWERKLKGLMRLAGRIRRGGGLKKAERFEQAVRNYVEKAYEVETKVHETIEQLRQKALGFKELLDLTEATYFHTMLIKHIDLIERRVLKGEEIPHEEKIFSLFEPHTEWVNKGKVHPNVELGHKLLITTDQYGLVLDYKVLEESSDVNETVPLADRLLSRYGEGEIQSISFDKGFSDQEDRELLSAYIPEVVMPKKGRRTQAEQERESGKRFKHLRCKHSAIESAINSLEHHGLNRCMDKGLKGFTRYTGLGILSYNLHKIGKRLLEKKRALAEAA
jgi:hypothetical protein